jgi:hypothetical protein
MNEMYEWQNALYCLECAIRISADLNRKAYANHPDTLIGQYNLWDENHTWDSNIFPKRIMFDEKVVCHGWC